MDRDATHHITLRSRDLQETEDVVRRDAIESVLEAAKAAAGLEVPGAREPDSEYVGAGRPLTAPAATDTTARPISERRREGFVPLKESEFREELRERTRTLFQLDLGITVEYELDPEEPARLILTYDVPVQIQNSTADMYFETGSGELIPIAPGTTGRRVVVESQSTTKHPTHTTLECVAEDGDITWRSVDE